MLKNKNWPNAPGPLLYLTSSTYKQQTTLTGMYSIEWRKKLVGASCSVRQHIYSQEKKNTL